MLMLAGFRAMQGIGAGGLMSLPLAIMGDMLAPRERAKYQGYFLAVFGVSSLIGPLVGGLFSGASQILFITGWRWVFLINVPIGAVALFMVLTFLHLPRFGEHRTPRIDWWGATAVVATLVPLPAGRGAGTQLGLGIVGVDHLLRGRRPRPDRRSSSRRRLMGDDAIIPLKLFRSRVFSMATCSACSSASACSARCSRCRCTCRS